MFPRFAKVVRAQTDALNGREQEILRRLCRKVTESRQGAATDIGFVGHGRPRRVFDVKCAKALRLLVGSFPFGHRNRHTSSLSQPPKLNAAEAAGFDQALAV